MDETQKIDPTITSTVWNLYNNLKDVLTIITNHPSKTKIEENSDYNKKNKRTNNNERVDPKRRESREEGTKSVL